MMSHVNTFVRELRGTAGLLMCRHELAGKGFLTVLLCPLQSSVRIVIFEVSVFGYLEHGAVYIGIQGRPYTAAYSRRLANCRV